MLRISNLTRITARFVVIALLVALVSASAGVSFKASAAPLSTSTLGVGLGQVASFSALGKAGVTNTGDSVLSGDVGADSSITGFPPGIAASKVFAPAVNGAEADAQTAYLALQSGSGTLIGPQLANLTLHPGKYDLGNALLQGGPLTLDGKGTYIFRMSSGLTSFDDVDLINGASPCDVFWQVTSSATLNAGSFAGTIIANIKISLLDGVRLDGRALALTDQVTLINNSISGPNCSGSGGGAAHASVTYECTTDGRLAVTVGVSAGTVVHGLGSDITSSTDTGNNKIVRYLSPGHYEWNATPPEGKYLLDVDHGVIDVPICGSATVVVKKVVALPNTGGAPLQSEAFPWTLVLAASVIGAMVLALSVQACRRRAHVA